MFKNDLLLGLLAAAKEESPQDESSVLAILQGSKSPLADPQEAPSFSGKKINVNSLFAESPEKVDVNPSANSSFTFVSPFVAAKMASSSPSAPETTKNATKLPLQDINLELVTANAIKSTSDIITVVGNKPEPVKSIIAVDSNYIVYAVKGGKIRIINQESGKMELVKGIHQSQVNNLKIKEAVTMPGVCYLMSISSDTFAIGKIENQDEVTYTNLINLKLENAVACWHPFRTGKFLLASKDQLVKSMVAQKIQDLNQCACRIQLSSNIESVAFSDDETVIAAGLENGELVLLENADSFQKISQFKVTSGKIEDLAFMGEVGMTNSANTCLILSSSQGQEYRLVGFNGSVLRKLTLKSQPFNCHSFFNDYLILSDNSKSALLSVHVKAPTATTTKTSIDLVKSKHYDNLTAGFDYAASIQVDEPLVDCCPLMGEQGQVSFYVVQQKSIKQLKAKRSDLYNAVATVSSSVAPVTSASVPSPVSSPTLLNLVLGGTSTTSATTTTSTSTLEAIETRIVEKMTSLYEKQQKDLEKLIKNEVSVENQLKSAFQSKFIPGMQQAVKEMMVQLNASIVERLENPFNEQLLKLRQDLTAEISKLADQVATLSEERVPIKTGTLSASASAEAVDIKYELTRLLDAGEYEQSFIKALGSSDLQLVLYVCSKTRIKTIFSEKCLVSQPVILSLIHQLTLELGKSTGFKLSWLQEALVHLDRADGSIASHVERVLGIVKKRIDEFAAGCSDSATLKQCRVIGLILGGMNNL